MGIQINVGKVVGFKVAGTYQDEKGIKQPFDFKLICDRLDDEEYEAKVKASSDDNTVVDFMLDVIRDWDDVRDDNKKKLDYSPEAYRTLCKLPGVGRLAFDAFRYERGAKPKN